MSEFSTIVYQVADQVARITLNRVDVRNAQDKTMLYELNDAFDLAAQDDGVKVIVLDANGPHFSSGHDLSDQTSMADFQPVSNWGGFGKPGAEGYQSQEEEIYLGLCWRWRNLPKPTIAQVHGKVIAGGLMLIWVCDLIIASDDATFSDPVVAFGVNGVEYFAHPWEMGPRKAKELLFTGDKISAEEAKALGMVNHVVAADTLHDVHPNDGRTHRQQAKYGAEIGEAERQSSPRCPRVLDRAAGRYVIAAAGSREQPDRPWPAGGSSRCSGDSRRCQAIALRKRVGVRQGR